MPAHQKPYAEYMDALRDQISPERWAKKLREAVDRGDPRMLEYVGNRFLGLPHRAPEDAQAIRQAVAAQAQASALVVMVDGKVVESVEAQRAAARAMLERFRQKREPEKPQAETEPPAGP